MSPWKRADWRKVVGICVELALCQLFVFKGLAKVALETLSSARLKRGKYMNFKVLCANSSRV